MTFSGKTLLITGGTGSFGNAVLKSFLHSDIHEIRIFSRDEKKQDDMRKKYSHPKIKFYLGDVRDFTSILSATRCVDYIFHAAALKQVPSCEFYPMQAVQTNIIGTENVLEAAIQNEVSRVVCLSTDKAVYPINAMGISKAMMEKVMVAKSRNLNKSKTVICGTRYGNVMASRGSVIPLFIEQILAGKPLTVTDPQMTRFMMTLSDAVDLVLYAFEHGANGDLFVQKAPAATIETLARALNTILGKPDWPIEIIGTRHGEKLFEALLSREEMASAEDLGKYYRVSPDMRDLNYTKYVEQGEQKISLTEDYNSHNTQRLDVSGMQDLLLKLECIRAVKRGDTFFSGGLSMKVFISGANGFLGKNLVVHLRERYDVELVLFTRKNLRNDLCSMVKDVDFIFHLAGVNRPENPEDFQVGNAELTKYLCDAVSSNEKRIPIVYTSSIQANQQNLYGASKQGAEDALLALNERHGNPVHVFRLPNVFGKWARPDYNSVVATFCHNITRDLPVHINDPNVELTLVYIDDVIARFVSIMDGEQAECPFVEIEQTYQITVRDLAKTLADFRESRETLISERVGTGLMRKLYSTYVSYIPADKFSYKVPRYADSRGVFVEMMKTQDSGQFSFFTAYPGVTRGGHYHHSKTEKFMVIKGRARFRFHHIVTGELFELFTSGDTPEIVETAPGWTHDITNIGAEEMIVMIWANEIFDRENPDTFAHPLPADSSNSF